MTDIPLTEVAKYYSSLLNHFSTYQNAPDKLCSALLDLNKILINYKLKNGENDTYKKFYEIEKSLQYVFCFIQDIILLYKDCQLIKTEKQILVDRCNLLEGELNAYKVIEHEILTNDLELKKKVIENKFENK